MRDAGNTGDYASSYDVMSQYQPQQHSEKTTPLAADTVRLAQTSALPQVYQQQQQKKRNAKIQPAVKEPLNNLDPVTTTALATSVDIKNSSSIATQAARLAVAVLHASFAKQGPQVYVTM